MAWFLLIIAGCFEVAWAIALKYSVGFTKPVPSVVMVVTMLISVWLLGVAAKTLPLGTAYAVWTGIGVLGAVALGIVLFGEPVTAGRLACIALIVLGIIGLKLA